MATSQCRLRAKFPTQLVTRSLSSGMQMIRSTLEAATLSCAIVGTVTGQHKASLDPVTALFRTATFPITIGTLGVSSLDFRFTRKGRRRKAHFCTSKAPSICSPLAPLSRETSDYVIDVWQHPSDYNTSIMSGDEILAVEARINFIVERTHAVRYTRDEHEWCFRLCSDGAVSCFD